MDHQASIRFKGKSSQEQNHPKNRYDSFPKLPFWGPYNKDSGILGSILGSLDFGKLPYRVGSGPNVAGGGGRV